MAEKDNEYCNSRIIHQAKINKAKKRILAAGKVEQLAQLFKAISDPGRINILQALKYDELCVCDLAAFLEVSESAVSHQLRILRQLQLVANRREGPVLYYRLNKEIAIQLLDLGLKHIEK